MSQGGLVPPTSFSLPVSAYGKFLNVQLFLVLRKLKNKRKISSLVPLFLTGMAVGLSPPSANFWQKLETLRYL